MSRRMIKVISLILTVALLLDCFVLPTTTALASNGKTDEQVALSSEDKAKNKTSPAPSEKPKETTEPTDVSEPNTEPSSGIKQQLKLPGNLIEPTNQQMEALQPESSDFKENKELDEKKNKEYKDQAKKENKQIQINELCDEYTTVFQNPDGTKTAYSFGTKVRFKDEAGNYTEIDNQLIQTNDEKKQEGYTYKNKAGYVDVYLPSTLIVDTPVSMEYDKYKIEMIPLINEELKKKIDQKLEEEFGKNQVEKIPVNEMSAEQKDIEQTDVDVDASNIAEAEKEKFEKENIVTLYPEYSAQVQNETVNNIKNKVNFAKEEDKKKAVENGTAAEIDSALNYKSGINDSIIFQYTPVNNGLKECIILKKYTGVNSFQFKLNVENLTVVLRDDNYIILMDGDKEVGMMPAPFMFDSYTGKDAQDAKHMSENVKYSLQETENKGEYILTLTADKSFLEDKSTVYPVTIDPTAQIMEDSAEIDDSFITSRYPNNRYGADTRLKVGWSDDLSTSRAYVRMNYLPGLNNGMITSATYSAYQDYSSSPLVTYNIHNVTSGWSESDICWNNQASLDAGACSAQTIGNIGWYTWDITNLVSAWYNGSVPNNGMVIKYASDTSGTKRYKRFVSSNDGGSAKAFFTINYSDAPQFNVASSYSSGANTATGFVVLGWNYVPGAVGYKVYAWNGAYYQPMDLGNVLSWDSRTRSIWPTPQEIQSGGYVLHMGGGGAQLANDPQNVYINARSGYEWAHNYWFRVSAYNAFGQESSIEPNCVCPVLPDSTRPNQPLTISAIPNFSGPTGSITVNWSGASDNPVGMASGINRYQVAISKNGTWMPEHYKTLGSGSSSCVFDNPAIMSDNATYQFSVLVVDNLENYADWKASSVYPIGDFTGPTAPSSFTISPSDWTKSMTPTITWSGINDANPSKVQYRVADTNGNTIAGLDWKDIDRNGITGYPVSGSYVINNPQHPEQAFANLPDGEYRIYIRGVDSKTPTPNIGVDTSSVVYKKDNTAPEVTIDSPSNNGTITGTVNITATITNNDGQSGFGGWTLDYGVGTDPSQYYTLTEGDTLLDQQAIYAWDTTWLSENTPYTLRLRAKDTSFAGGNIGVWEIHLLKSADSQNVAAELQIDTPSSSTYDITSEDVDVAYQRANDGGYTGLTGKLYVNNELKGTESASGEGFDFNAAEKYFDSTDQEWKFKYPEGTTQYFYVQANDTENNELYSLNSYQTVDIEDVFDSSENVEELSNTQCVNGVMKLISNSIEGSFESVTKTFAGDISYLDLIVNETKPAGTSIEYKVSINGGEWQDITPVSTNGGTTSNFTNRKYFNLMGNSLKLKAILTPSASQSPEVDMWKMDARYTIYANAVIVHNDFGESSRGFTNLDNTKHDEQSGLIEIKNLTAGTATSGTIESTPRYAAGEALKAVLEVDDDTPTGSNIIYKVSADGGAHWQTITPGSALNESDWVNITYTGHNVILKAELQSSNGTSKPTINEWTLSVQEKVIGAPHQIKLIDEPDNLSSLADANYMTLLRWAPSTTEGVVYNVYRSDEPYFVPSSSTLVAEQIPDNSWSDYNLNYSDTFYYKVTALKEFNGLMRESIPSLEVSATVVDKDNIQEQLGLQDYWSYSGFNTGSGTGYVNVANGNVVYTSTDIVVPGPFFAAVMRRTFNSLADTKTPMGYGWDFSFNTCLLKQYDNGVEVAMVLKDGDGSFHRFAKAGNDYESAKGTFMSFKHDETAHEYLIIRKDNITYHFDDQSLKLKKFTDPHLKYDGQTYENIALSFTYDDRGNIHEVTNEVGEKLTFTYKVQGAASDTEPDYTYVNENIDLIDTVTWKEDVQTGAVSRVFHYEYVNDRLTRMWTTIDGATYEEVFAYNANKQLVNISDPMDKETVIAYDGDGKVSRITSPIGEYSDFGYTTSTEANCTGKTTITSDRGIQTSFDYNANGLVKMKTDPLGYWIRYEHNDDYLVTSVKSQNNFGSVTKYLKTVYEYNADGNITDILPQVSTDDLTYTSLHADTQYVYYTPVAGVTDNYNNQPWIIRKQKDDSTTVETKYGYNYYGDVTLVNDPEEKMLWKTYSTAETMVNNTIGYLKSVEDDFGKETRYGYDSKGRVETVSEFDKNNTLVRTVSSYTYDHYGRTDTVSDAMGHVTDIDYDILGRKTRTTYADENVEEWQYYFNGNLKKAINRRGFDVDYFYDDLGRQTSAIYPDGSTNSISYTGHWDSDGDGYEECNKVVKTDGEGRTSTEYYDKAGRLVKSEANGTNKTYEYDMAGNMIKSKDAELRTVEAEYDELGRKVKTINDRYGENIVVQYTYDYLGNLLTTIDGDGYVTTNTYDNDSRLKSVTQVVDSRNITTSYTYDIEEDGYIKNRITTPVNNPYNGIIDIVSETWFDEMGRKVKELNRGDTRDDDNAAGEYIETNFTYYLNFQPKIITRNDGTKEKYVYNELGQTEYIYYYLSSEDPANPSTNYIYYEYDANGNVETESFYHGLIDETNTYAYNEMDRLVQMTQGKLDVNNLPDEAQGGISINYDYNDAGQLLSYSYTKGNSTRNLSYVYNTSSGLLDQIKLDGKLARQYNYRTSGYLDWVKDYRQFDTDGAAFIKRSYMYNDAGLMTGMSYADYLNEQDTGTPKEAYSLHYNDRGYLTDENVTTYYDGRVTTEKDYQYDAIGRLKQAKIGDKTTDYTYDDAGNRLTQYDGKDTWYYNYNQFNQLTQVTKNDLTTLYESYEYDDRGNQQYKYSDYTDGTAGKVEKNTYDLNNTLQKIESGANVNSLSVINTNAYNAKGQRVRKLDDGATTLYYYSGSAILFTTDQNYTVATENILDLGGQIIASERFDGAFDNMFFFYNYDYRGSTTAIIKPDGTTVEEYTYDAFGNLSAKGTSGFKNEVTFTGSVTDKSSGLQYMNARFYNPSTGRFLSQDTYSGNPYEPWTQHLYSYCGNNPVNMVDPTGHVVEWIAAMWGVALVEPTPIGEIVAALVTAVAVVFCGVQLGEIGENIFSNPSTSTSATITAGTLTTGITAGISDSITYYKEHTKGARPSTKDKHTKPRPGRPNTKNRQDKKWQDRSGKRR